MSLPRGIVVLFGKAGPQRFRSVSNQSQVEVIVGHAAGNPRSDPDIGFITPEQVLGSWRKRFV
jgi:hypothetical protein